jgi:hypothetical protein
MSAQPKPGNPSQNLVRCSGFCAREIILGSLSETTFENIYNNRYHRIQMLPQVCLALVVFVPINFRDGYERVSEAVYETSTGMFFDVFA